MCQLDELLQRQAVKTFYRRKPQTTALKGGVPRGIQRWNCALNTRFHWDSRFYRTGVLEVPHE